MRLVPTALLLLLAATAACAKSAESKATESKVEPRKDGAPALEGGGGAQPRGTGDVTAAPEGPGIGAADPGDKVAAVEGDGDAGKKPPGAKKDPKGPAGEPATKTSWEIVDPNGTRHGPDGSFNLEIAGPASVAPGAEATFKLTVTPGDGYKINYCEPGEADCNDFPVSLKLTATEGVTLPKTALTKADLTAFNKKELVLEFKATPTAAGSYTVPGKYKFAVCQEEACLPRRLDMWFVLAAK